MEPEKIDFKHFAEIQIRFNDIDGLGHVNNAMQATYFDLGRVRYFEDLNGGSIDWKKFAMVIASVHTNFMAPIFLHEKIMVKTMVTNLGEKSLQMMQVLVDADNGELKSTCESVMVGIDFKTGKSTELTEEIRHKVSTFEEY